MRFSESALRQLRKLDRQVQRRIIAFLEKRVEPYPYHSVDADGGGETSVSGCKPSFAFLPSISAGDHHEKAMTKGGM